MSFQLERGEAALFNNCAVLHNRTAFEDHDEPHLKRHVMRLWLMHWDGRPTVEGVRYHKGGGDYAADGQGAVLRESESGHRCNAAETCPINSAKRVEKV